MPFESILGHGPDSLAILYDFKVDFEAVELNARAFLPATKSSELLEECKAEGCINDHPHTCAISITNNSAFGAVLIYCLLPKCVRHHTLPRCPRHLEKIAQLCPGMQQEMMSILYEHRVDLLEERSARALDELGDVLAQACEGVSRRFPDATKRFRENAFNRLRALHERKESAVSKAYDTIQKMRETEFDLANIANFHRELPIDKDVDRLIANLRPIETEARSYMMDAADPNPPAAAAPNPPAAAAAPNAPAAAAAPNTPAAA
ncbi:hypothetical protein SCHPADRAFT_947840 [Schizopora paradoxa]|uniref:Uncharacterized protein n=1 Tax=Schizopora paradoxa TaxID=27342 RepID=A0A0H2QXC3_9AGAM|nr:hypothetical protein SCHPADRAFT_947840 [Schizopora paradoxa]